MSKHAKPSNLFTLKEVLPVAEKGGYAIGAFSPRTSPMIQPVLQAGQQADSPLIVQIAQSELERHEVSVEEFADEFYRQLAEQKITVPVVLHLDHTKNPQVIREAIRVGFTSVMIDASERELEDNIAISREICQYAHSLGVSVEAELGQIGTTDFVESERDDEFFTNPHEAERFARETGVDALAVSVGTAHGVYLVRQPRIDYERLMAIRRLTPVAMVIHGGSGIPAEMLKQAYRLVGGGPSKVNIATDLELAILEALGRQKFLTDAETRALPQDELSKARAAVADTVREKIDVYLDSANRAADFASLMC